MKDSIKKWERIFSEDPHTQSLTQHNNKQQPLETTNNQSMSMNSSKLINGLVTHGVNPLNNSDAEDGVLTKNYEKSDEFIPFLSKHFMEINTTTYLGHMPINCARNVLCLYPQAPTLSEESNK